MGKESPNLKGSRLVAGLFTEMCQARIECHYIFNVLNGKNSQPRILSPPRLSFWMKRDIKSFPNKN